MSRSASPKSNGHFLIFDPVPFHGGSKMASFEIVRQSVPSGCVFTVLTCDPESWRTAWSKETLPFTLVTFLRPGALAQATSGWKYWIKHFYFMIVIVKCLLMHPRIHSLIGISGPGVDMALYGCQKIVKRRLLQFIHGPVPCSRSVGYCLTRADRVYYLTSALPSIQRAISHYCNSWLPSDPDIVLSQQILSSDAFHSFSNGLGRNQWPTPTRYATYDVFWAASLLKWKGLDTLVAALRLLPDATALKSHICFIRPHHISLPQSQAPVSLAGVTWYEQPDHLDSIRASCGIFVSTSEQEPFGLSILEALAAGLCVVIPQDGAYWDQQLRHNVNCVKYPPNCSVSLARTLKQLVSHPVVVRSIGHAGRRYAERYRAEICYLPIVQDLAPDNAKASLTDTGEDYA